MSKNNTPTNDDDIKSWRQTWHLLFRKLLWVVGFAYFPVVMSFVGAEKAQMQCLRIATNVHKSGSDMLITEQGLLQIVRDEFPEMEGSLISTINFDKVESRLEQSSVVRRCEAYPTADGTVHIEIYQRKPIMRVFAADGSYYMDEEGHKITAKPGMRCHTVIVNGHVNALCDQIDGLVALCRHIAKDNFWRSMIEQVTVLQSGEFMLVPRVGNHIVDFGTAEGYERKLADLLTLYKKGWAKDEWNAYKRVSLKYKGQIICTKR